MNSVADLLRRDKEGHVQRLPERLEEVGGERRAASAIGMLAADLWGPPRICVVAPCLEGQHFDPR